MNKNKKLFLMFLIEVCIFIIGISIITITVDPFFHYHKPLNSLQYPINNQRYQNNGIVKNYDYDAIITGTSMTENFRTSEMNEIFGVNSIKVSFSGASFKEINQNLKIAIKNNDQIKYIVRGLDFGYLIYDKDYMKYDESWYPNYLYDNNLLNDVKYVLNKEVLKNVVKVIQYTKNGNKTTSFDDYSSWYKAYTFGKSSVNKTYSRSNERLDNVHLTENDVIMVEENIIQNVYQIAKDNPNIKFYYFYTPYCIYYWDNLNNKGNLIRYIEAEKKTTEILLDLDNVYLFSFWDNYDLITDLNNYKDILHYSEKINSEILKWMKSNNGRLTKENYEDYYKKITKFYTNYDYDSLFK